MLKFSLSDDNNILQVREYHLTFTKTEIYYIDYDLKNNLQSEYSQKRTPTNKSLPNEKKEYILKWYMPKAIAQKKQEIEAYNKALINGKIKKEYQEKNKKMNQERKEYENFIYSQGLSEYEADRLYTIKCIELNCKYELNNYKFVDNKPFHAMEQGKKTIKKYFDIDWN